MHKMSPGQLVTAENQDTIEDPWVVDTGLNAVVSVHLFVFEIFHW